MCFKSTSPFSNKVTMIFQEVIQFLIYFFYINTTVD